jgi:hypothetical protein
MPIQYKTGTALSYDSSAMTGDYTETATGDRLIFENTKPTVNISPGDSVEILYKTPSGREVNVVIKVNGRDI